MDSDLDFSQFIRFDPLFLRSQLAPFLDKYTKYRINLAYNRPGLHNIILSKQDIYNYLNEPVFLSIILNNINLNTLSSQEVVDLFQIHNIDPSYIFIP